MNLMDDRFIEEAADTGSTAGKLHRAHRKHLLPLPGRWAAAAAAVIAISIALPNVSAETAYAMQSLPVIGAYFKAVTFRHFTFEGENATADVSVPRIAAESAGSGNAAQNPDTAAAGDAAVQAQAARTAEEINREISTMTDRLIEQFRQEAADNGFAGTLDVQHETVTDDAHWYTLKLSIFEAKADGAEYDKYYTIDKTSGKQVTLSSLFKENSSYVSVLSENIKEQMRAISRKDPNQLYFLDSDMPETDFTEIRPDQNFYFNKDNQLVLCFDEGELAPMYMGTQEFTIPAELTEKLMK